jgi:hypothetical protein
MRCVKNILISSELFQRFIGLSDSTIDNPSDGGRESFEDSQENDESLGIRVAFTMRISIRD